MKIHITGAAGLIGSHLARAWVARGATVMGSDDMSAGYEDNVPEGCELVRADCCDIAAMLRAVEGAEVVYHCAASPHEGLSVFSPYTITRSIFVGTMAVLSACIQRGVGRLVFCSSMARYGGIEFPFRESSAPAPTDPYGVAKLAAEREVALLCRVHGMEYVIAVPHNVIGPGQRYTDPYRNVVAIMANRCLRGEAPIIYGDGNQRRCFSAVTDAVSSLVNMATYPVAGETINIGQDEDFTTINELCSMVQAVAGTSLDPIYMPARPQEVRHACCSADKARKMLDYSTTVSLRDGIAQMTAWIKRRGPAAFDYHLPVEIVTHATPRTWTERLI